MFSNRAIIRKILKNLDELETQYQKLSQETRDELEREFQGGTLILLKNMQRNFSDLTKKR
jgi:hypothetical protein